MLDKKTAARSQVEDRESVFYAIDPGKISPHSVRRIEREKVAWLKLTQAPSN